jgi:hypothetical protein
VPLAEVRHPPRFQTADPAAGLKVLPLGCDRCERSWVSLKIAPVPQRAVPFRPEREGRYSVAVSSTDPPHHFDGSACVHRPMPITDSGPSRSGIPVEADHRFRSKPIAERMIR